MRYKEILPQKHLTPYVKCFFSIETDEVITHEAKVLPGGYPELIFNLSDIYLHSAKSGEFTLTPPVDFLGQLTKPFDIRSNGKHLMLGIRFYAHSPAYFLNESMDVFNDQVSDLTGLLHKTTYTLYEKLMEAKDLLSRVALVEQFLLHRLSRPEKRFDHIHLVGNIMQSMSKNNFRNNVDQIGHHSGISNRYLQKLFLRYTGLTPKAFLKTNRFKNSIAFLDKKNDSLTAIAYHCGYFDQSHFIREFKKFSGGDTPTDYLNGREAEKK